jgi:hypothetical protein
MKFSYLSRSRTRDLPGCSILPQLLRYRVQSELRSYQQKLCFVCDKRSSGYCFAGVIVSYYENYCIYSVGSLTPHNSVRLHGLLQGELYFFICRSCSHLIESTPTNLHSLLTGMVLLFYMGMMFVPHKKHIYMPSQSVTGVSV